MPVDLMLVDDEEGVMRAAESTAQSVAHENNVQLEIIKFTRGTAALNYLREHVHDLPRGYLVDMRIPYDGKELAAPQQIYEFLKEHNATTHFRFYTGHISEHDRKVLATTGAQVLLKGRMDNRLENWLEGLMKAKS